MNRIKLFSVSAVALALGACAEIGPGERGVFVRMGEATESVGPGWHSYNPITTSLVSMNVRQTKLENKTLAYTKDVQQAEVAYTLTYSLSPDRALETYRDVGEDWAKVLIPQVIEQSIKDVFGNSEAVADTINRRGFVQAAIRTQLIANLVSRGITVHGFELTDIGFSRDFEAANERKQIAVEDATTAQNRTVQVQEEANQKVIAAEAEAESMRIRSQALASNPALTAYEAVQKWNGVICPQNSTCMYGDNGAVPIIGLGR